ncbi:MAG TPA: helix-turn-helix domain-containing protein [Amycolatopsis sp.]|jgi:AcrR family transcriptional regulator|nr:helix-turn-helix domain-containing protein [Amycolatopsis sp.]
MARWEPDAYGRIRQAALELFTAQGFENTTVTQIAERAGLNRRTFFHHFADKREVVFSGPHEVDELIVTEIRAQRESVDPLHASTAGLKSAAYTVFEHQREAAIARARIIAASSELQERDMLKRATLADMIADALRDRGTTDQAAVVAAWSAVAVFYAALASWTEPANRSPLAQLIDDILEQFLSAATPTRRAPKKRH